MNSATVLEPDKPAFANAHSAKGMVNRLNRANMEGARAGTTVMDGGHIAAP